jgi:hypothetical protein
MSRSQTVDAPSVPADKANAADGIFLRLFAAIGSMQLAVVLLAILVVVLAWGTYLETAGGAAVARFGVYGAWWFTLLGFLLGANIFAALIIRFPWSRRLTGFVVVHVGLLVLLLGCLVSRQSSFEATLAIGQGEASARAYEDSQHFELTPLSPTDDAAPAGETVTVPFNPGPFNWQEYRRLMWFPWRLRGHDQGVVYDHDGIRLEVFDYYADSQQLLVPRVDLRFWPGQSQREPLRLTLNVQPASGGPHAAQPPYGLGMHETLPTGQRVVFWMTGDDAQTAAFRNAAPDGPLGVKGRVVLYAGGKPFQWAIDDWKPGTRKPLGQSGLEVELVKYDPTFPGVRLAIHRGKEAARPMFLLGDFPDFNEQDLRDGVVGEYWYVPVAAGAGQGTTAKDDDMAERMRSQARAPRIDILQGADQKLYVRTWQAPKLSKTEVLPTGGNALAVFADTNAAGHLAIERFIPSDRPGRTVEPLPFSKKQNSAEPQARVRVTVDGQSEEFWLAQSGRDGQEPAWGARRIIAGHNRRLAVTLRQDQIDMAVAVRLHRFLRKLDPGSKEESHYSSLVDFLDLPHDKPLAENVLITMNRPADVADPQTGRSYRLFQSGFYPPRHPTISYLTVNSDPGRGLKYVGCLLVVVGIFLTYFMRKTSAPAAPQTVAS